MTQVTAQNREEAEILSDQNIDNSQEMLEVKLRMTFYGKN